MLIYRVTNKINNKVYIGQTTKALHRRKAGHIRDAFKRNSTNHFHRALRKHGKDNFSWEIVCKASSRDQLDIKESYYIGFYRAVGIYNNYKNYNTRLEIYTAKDCSGKNNYFYGKTGEKHPSSKQYKITSPSGDVFIVKGLRKFCKDNPQYKLSHNHLSYCATGRQKQTKGWSCSYYETKDA